MKKLVITLALGVLVFAVSNAQDKDGAQHGVSISIPEVFVLDIEGPSSEANAATVIDLTPDVPSDLEAGEMVNFSKTDASLTLNYTSIVSSGETRSVTVELDSDLPEGIELKVEAGSVMGGSGSSSSPKGLPKAPGFGSPKGSGGGASAGVTGSPTAAVVLGAKATNLVTGIGTCYTGEGNSNGHRLTYTLSTDADGFASIVATNGAPITRTVTYTITD